MPWGKEILMKEVVIKNKRVFRLLFEGEIRKNKYTTGKGFENILIRTLEKIGRSVISVSSHTMSYDDRTKFPELVTLVILEEMDAGKQFDLLCRFVKLFVKEMPFENVYLLHDA